MISECVRICEQWLGRLRPPSSCQICHGQSNWSQMKPKSFQVFRHVLTYKQKLRDVKGRMPNMAITISLRRRDTLQSGANQKKGRPSLEWRLRICWRLFCTCFVARIKWGMDPIL